MDQAVGTLKIYADLRWPDKTGIGVVKTELMKRTPPEFVVSPLAVDSGIGSPWSTVALAQALRRERPSKGDVFWSPGFVPPLFSKPPVVVTVHDLLHLHYYSRWHVAYYNYVFRPLYRRCRAIVCDSDYSRNEFLEWSGFPSDRCFTVYLSASDAFHAAPAETTKPRDFPYVLYPGNRRVYKNIGRLLRAYGRSTLPKSGIKLVLTGTPDGATQELASALGIADQVVFAGFVDEAVLVQLYRQALAIAFVSLYEGFGLPIVEGFASGVPVLTSNTSSMAEIAGDAALVVDPLSIDAIAAGLDELANSQEKRQMYIRRGRERLGRFDWDVSASKVWAILRNAASP